MQFSKEVSATQIVHNGSSGWIEKSATRDNCSASLGEPRDAEQLIFWQNFQSASHNH